MIDGLLLLLELGLMLVLLITVWNAHRRGREDNLGFFAYKVEREQPPAPPPRWRTRAQAQQRGGPPHA
jgi:hypothetical protein